MLAAEEEIEGGASPRVAPFADVRDLGALLQRAEFALPVVDADTVTVTYADPLALMRELRAMGATNVLRARRRTPLRRATLMRALEIYRRALRPAGRPRARHLRDHHADRLGAARRASRSRCSRARAKMRLADALGTVEQPAGDAAPPPLRASGRQTLSGCRRSSWRW